MVHPDRGHPTETHLLPDRHRPGPLRLTRRAPASRNPEERAASCRRGGPGSPGTGLLAAARLRGAVRGDVLDGPGEQVVEALPLGRGKRREDLVVDLAQGTVEI